MFYPILCKPCIDRACVSLPEIILTRCPFSYGQLQVERPHAIAQQVRFASLIGIRSRPFPPLTAGIEQIRAERACEYVPRACGRQLATSRWQAGGEEREGEGRAGYVGLSKVPQLGNLRCCSHPQMVLTFLQDYIDFLITHSIIFGHFSVRFGIRGTLWSGIEGEGGEGGRERRGEGGYRSPRMVKIGIFLR